MSMMSIFKLEYGYDIVFVRKIKLNYIIQTQRKTAFNSAMQRNF